MEDRQGLWSHIQPQRGLLAVQGLQQPESLAGTQRPVCGGWSTRLNRSLSRWVNMGLPSWGSLLNEAFSRPHAREAREQGLLVLNQGEKMQRKRQESGFSGSAV